MSEDEKKLRRLNSWDRYQAAKQSYLSHRDRLTEWGNTLRPLTLALVADQLTVTKESYQALPTVAEFSTGVDEFRESVTELKAAWASAKDYGFPVDPNDLKGTESAI